MTSGSPYISCLSNLHEVSGSTDPDTGDTLTYAWTKTAGPDVTLSSTSAAQPTFTAPTLGANDAAVTLTFSLIVTDDKSNASTADTVSITVNPPANSAPTANAGADQTAVASAATVTLDGSGSTDPDTGDTLTYAWTKTGGAGCDLVEHKRSTTNVHSANTWGQ